jgi:hypothetical protein
MPTVVTGPWSTGGSPTPRERQHEQNHAAALDFVIAELESATPEDRARGIRDIEWFAARFRFQGIRERAQEVLEKAEAGRS